MKTPILADIRKQLASTKVISIENGKAIIGVVRKDVIVKQGGRVIVPVRPFLKAAL